MHWVHIIKAPTVKRQVGDAWTISLLVRIMSDLSDRELAVPISVRVSLMAPDEQKSAPVWQQDNWKPKYWLEPLSESTSFLNFRKEYLLMAVSIPQEIEFAGSRQRLDGKSLCISAGEPSMSSTDPGSLSPGEPNLGLPPVVPAYSAPLHSADQKNLVSDDKAFRLLHGTEHAREERTQLKIWERTGESMERHMW